MRNGANIVVRVALLGIVMMASGCALGVDQALIDNNEHLAAALDNARDNGNRGNGNIPGAGGQNGNGGGDVANNDGGNNGGNTGGATGGGEGPTTADGPNGNGNGGKHANSGRGNGSEEDENGEDVDPGRSGGKNKGGD